MCTGVTLILKKTESQSLSDLKVHTFHETTEVDMSELSDEVIRAYVNSGEPMDKAGSYGIQDLGKVYRFFLYTLYKIVFGFEIFILKGCSLVESITGDFFNVMGFPAHKFSVELKKILDDS